MSDILAELERLVADLKKLGPVLQAIAIYDCEATKENCIKLDYDAKFLSVVTTFGMEAGPVVRWFWKSAPTWDFNLEVVPINEYGEALVISRGNFDRVLKDSLSVSGTKLLGPKVYDLNSDRRSHE